MRLNEMSTEDLVKLKISLSTPQEIFTYGRAQMMEHASFLLLRVTIELMKRKTRV